MKFKVVANIVKNIIYYTDNIGITHINSLPIQPATKNGVWIHGNPPK